MSLKNSIILCTYNEANHIEKTISELEKNIPNLELVIVDDFSTDGTVDIIKKLNQDNKYKTVFRKRSRTTKIKTKWFCHSFSYVNNQIKTKINQIWKKRNNKLSNSLNLNSVKTHVQVLDRKHFVGLVLEFLEYYGS